MNQRSAREDVKELLIRARVWLTTTAVAQRTGLSRRRAQGALVALVAAGAAERRDDRENARVAEWRTAE